MVVVGAKAFVCFAYALIRFDTYGLCHCFVSMYIGCVYVDAHVLPGCMQVIVLEVMEL